MEAYIVSIVICFIAIWTITWIYGDQIMENGWSDDVADDLGFVEDDTFNVILYTLGISCIPVIRFFYMILILVMATFTKESVTERAKEFLNRF